MFRNNLKEDTTKAMSVLRKGATRPVMITGDTAMTGIYIARKCKMVDPKATLLLGELKVGVDVDDAKSSDIVWTNIDPATNEKANVVGLQQVLDSLMGLEIIGQVFGIAVINFGFMIIAIAALFAQEFFACNEWDATKLDLSKWMLLGDNFEGETLGMLVMLQVTNTGAVGNFSAGYRQAWHKNWMFVLVFIASYVIVSYITLADPNRLGCWFRFQCGDPEALVKLGYFDHVDNITFSTGQDYLNINGHNVMPTEFRSVIWIIGLCNLAVVVFFVRFVVLGPVRTCIRNKWGKKRDMLY